MASLRCHVIVLLGEGRREGDFAATETLAEVANSLFVREQGEQRRLRFVFGGSPRPAETPLSHLIALSADRGRVGASTLTLHAVVGAPGSTDAQRDAAPAPNVQRGHGPPVFEAHNRRGGGGWRARGGDGGGGGGGGGGPDDDCVDVGGVRIRTSTLLLCLTGLLLLACCYGMVFYPSSFATVTNAAFLFLCGAAWIAAAATRLGAWGERRGGS